MNRVPADPHCFRVVERVAPPSSVLYKGYVQIVLVPDVLLGRGEATEDELGRTRILGRPKGENPYVG